MQGVPIATPILSRLVNPIPTRGGHIMPTNYYWHPQIFDLPPSLLWAERQHRRSVSSEVVQLYVMRSLTQRMTKNP